MSSRNPKFRMRFECTSVTPGPRVFWDRVWYRINTMLIELEQQGDICVLRVSGRLVTGTNPEYVHDKMSEIKNGNYQKVLADLRELAAIGSLGIGFLAGAYASVTKTPGGRFVLVGPQRRVQEILQLTRLNTVIPIAADIASGMALLSENTAASAPS